MSYNRKQHTFIRVADKYKLWSVHINNPQISAIQSQYVSIVRHQNHLLSDYTKGKIFCGTSTINDPDSIRIENYTQYINSQNFDFPCTPDNICHKCFSPLFNGTLNVPIRRRQFTCINKEYINQHLVKCLKQNTKLVTNTP